MVQTGESFDSQVLYQMVGHLVSMHRDGKISDIDLYNSILRQIYLGAGENRKELKKIIAWLDKAEQNNSGLQEQYQAETVRENAGDNYFEGLQRLMPLRNSVDGSQNP